MIGRDVVNQFSDSSGNVWEAHQSQIYPTLAKLELEGLIQSDMPRGARAVRRTYTITEAGLAELQGWLEKAPDYPAERDGFRLKMLFFDRLPFDTMRRHLRNHMHRFDLLRADYERHAERLRNRETDYVQVRLSVRPPEDHETIVGVGAFALSGLAEQARLEVDWAGRGLALIDHLEAQRSTYLRDREAPAPND